MTDNRVNFTVDKLEYGGSAHTPRYDIFLTLPGHKTARVTVERPGADHSHLLLLVEALLGHG